MMNKKFRSISPDKILFVFIIINICIGLFIFQDYGISIDELRDQRTAASSLEVYLHPFDTESLEHLPISKYYGISQSMLFNLFSNFFSPLFNVEYFSARHLSYFLTFQYGVVAFYYLAKRFVPPWHALAGTLLFMTQPFIFGHAFINSKDIPILSIFMLTVVTGFSMVDHFEQKNELLYGSFAEEFHQKFPRLREKLSTWKIQLSVISALLLILLLFHEQVKRFIFGLITYIYNLPDNPFTRIILSPLSQNRLSVPAEAYAQKAEILYDKYYLYAIIIAFIIILLVVFLELIPSFTRYIFAVLKSPQLWIASFVWGMCMSTRVIGFAAGGMVGLYYLMKVKKRALMPLVLYTLIASAVLYLTWPFLWHYGVKGLIQSLFILSDFPWDREILFKGEIIGLPLPRDYVPTLMLFKYTIPFMLLALLGLFLVFKSRYIKKDIAQYLIILCWFFIPFIFVIGFNVTIYKSRQLLFITPPLFLLAAVSLSYISDLVKKKWTYIVILVLILAPGIFYSVSLHPYQYIYYNGLTGGIQGAFRQYELEYWLTSSKYAMEYINENAPYGAKVGGPNTALPYVRDDIQYFLPEGGNYSFREEVDYVILPSKGNADIRFYTDAEDVYEEKINGVRLFVIRKLD